MCGSTDLIKNVRIVDKGMENTKYDLSLEVYEDPEAWVFKGTHEVNLSATVCESCGYVMLFVTPQGVDILKRYKR